MTIWWLAVIIGMIVAGGGAFIWLVLTLHAIKPKDKKSDVGAYGEAADQDVEHIFNSDFREELRNRGRLHFEKIITDNAEFLQQDLRLTTSQLNEYMKTEITQKLQEEFVKYEQSIADAKNLAIESIKKTNLALEEQRQVLGQQVQSEIAQEKARIISRFEEQLTDIVDHYVIAAIGDQIDLNDQLDYILSDLETNKKAMLEDLKNAS